MSNEGWICPRCGRVNAPWNPWCNCEPKSNMTANTNKDTPIRDFMVKPQMRKHETLTGTKEVLSE